LYFLIRYSVFIDAVVLTSQFFDLSPDQCAVVSALGRYLFVIGISIIEIMLLLRTWVIWDRNKRVAYALSTIFILSFANMLVFTVILQIILEENILLDFLPIEGCLFPAVVATLFALQLIWNSILAILETSVIIFTLVRGYRFRKSLVTDGAPRRWKIESLTSIVYRDALLNYVYILILLTIVSLLVSHLQGLTLALLYWQRVAYAVLGSRCMLNLRKAKESRNITDESSLGPMVFRDKRSMGVGNPTRSFVERVGDDVENWLVPDPRLYHSRASISSIRATGTKDEIESNQ